MTETNADFEALLEFLKLKRSFDFSGYKRPSLMRRVLRRMQAVGISEFEPYTDYLEVHPEEFDLLFNTILINVTAFFRDIEAWDYLRDEVIPALLVARPDGYLRVWSAGSATGEEAYSLAMLLAEALGAEAFSRRVKIYATDADEEELLIARQGVYTAQRLEAVPENLREKYFERTGVNYVFRQDLRRAVIFGRHDLVNDAPISNLDLLLCRNTLMYFNREVQARILPRFHFALNSDGVLFLGKAEMLLSHGDLFRPLNLRHRMFNRIGKMTLRNRLLVMAQTGSDDGGRRVSNEIRLREVAFETSPEAVFVVSSEGDLELANNQARSLFSLTEDDIGSRFQDLRLSYQPLDLRSPIESAINERQLVKLGGVEMHGGNGSFYDVQVVPLMSNGDPALGASIIFRDVSLYRRLQLELENTNAELENAYEELQSTNEELETTNEELQSTNEELETTNEELQSTNEELETINEEMQATNEELETMNEELRRRTDELYGMNSLMNSILSSLRAGVVVLDSDLHITVWNNHAEDLWGVRASEVTGASLFALDIGLPLEPLRDPLRRSLSGSVPHSEMTIAAINRRGKHILCRVSLSRLEQEGESWRGVIMLMNEVSNEENEVETLLEERTP